MREVFASINYVINKLEEKNLFKIAQEGHDIFAAVYRFVGQDGELVRSDDDKSEQYYESAAPSNMFENDLYSPMDKNKQRKWRVKSEVPSEYGTAPASSASPSATETPSTETFTSEAPSAGPSVTPESASVTVTTPSSYSGTESTSSEYSSSTSTPSGSGPSFSTGSGASTVDPTKVEYFDIKTLIKIVDYLNKVGKASDLELIDKLELDRTIVSKALDVLIKLGAIKYNNYNYQFTKSFDQVTTILTQYMKHHSEKIQESLSAEDNDDEIIDVDVEDPNEIKQIGERNSPTSSYEPTSTGLLSDSYLLSGAREPKLLGEKVYPTSPEEIQKNQETLNSIVKNLEKILGGNPTDVKYFVSGLLKNKELIDIVSDPKFEEKYSIESYYPNLKFIPYPGASRVGLEINGNTILKPAVSKPGTKTASAKKVLSMTNTFITNLENYGLKREADAMHDVFVKIANAYDLVNRPGVSVQAKKWIQDNVANIDAMTNLQLVNMMANLPLNVQTELKQIITNYKNTQGYKQNKPMGYQQPNQQAYQQGYQQGYQQQNMYQNQGGMVRPQ
jgi:predicted transcriptional regulator